MTQIRRPQDEREQRSGGDKSQVTGRSPDLLTLHRRTPIKSPAMLNRRLYEPIDERRRVVRAPKPLPTLRFFQRAQYRCFKRRVVLLKIEG